MNKNDLTQGNLWKRILIFSIPLMLSNVLQVLFNMTDIAVVGQFAGSAALGSVGSTSTLVALFTGILIGMSCGVNVLVALHYGSKKPKEVMETVHTSAIVCFALGVLLTVTGVIYARDILQLLNTKEELIEGAVKYLRIYFIGMPALALYNFGNGVYSAVGETRKPLIYLSVAGVVNVVLNLILVIGFDLGVAGVAVASVIAQYISAALVLASLLSVKDIYGLSPKKLRIHQDKVKAILTIGIPSAMQYAIFQVANLFVQVGVNSFDAVMVEGNSAAANADALVYDVMAAFYTACSSFMSQNYGAGKKDRVLKSFLVSLAYSFGIGTLMGVSLVVFGENFLALFTKDAVVIEAGMKRLTIMGLSYGVSAFMDASIAACRGLGKSVIPTFIVIMGSCVFRVIWVYTIFAHFQTIPSLYLLYIFSWTITAVAEMIYFIAIYKKQMQILQ